LIDLCLTPTLTVFQLHRGIITLQDTTIKRKWTTIEYGLRKDRKHTRH